MTWHGVPIPADPIGERADWLAKRRQGIGASDVAGILGLSPWSTPFTVWADKTQDLEEPPNDSMYWGSVLEDVVVDEFEKQTGLHVHGRNWLVHHPDHPWVMATIDGFAEESPQEWDHPMDAGAQYSDGGDVFEPLGLVEAKTDYSFGGWSDGVPDYIRIQAIWQMFTTGVHTLTWIPTLHGGRNFQIYEVEYDADLAQKIFQRVNEFRETHIIGGEQPDPDGSDATAGVLRDLWEADEDAVIELSPDMAADIEALRGWKAELKRVDEQVKELEARVKASLQEATVGTVGGVEAVTWKPVTSRRVATKRLKSERPDLYEKYSEESSYRRFMVKEQK